jgi:putative endopeptidase
MRSTRQHPGPLLALTVALSLSPTANAASSQPSPGLTAKQIAADVLGAMDPEADPCQDFYRYACGGWLERTKIPADQSRWMRSFSTVDERNQKIVREILEAAGKSPGTNPDTAKIGNYYGSCMDEAAIETAGLAPLQPLLDEIAKVDGAAALMTAAGKLQPKGINALFGLGVVPDFKRPDLEIGFMVQGGLGMPDRDYYVSEDPKKKELLVAYEKHVARMLGLLGESAETAGENAKDILAFETALAQAARPRADMRDVEALYHKLDLSGLLALNPRLDWNAFLAAADLGGVTEINVATPEFFVALERTILRTEPAALRAYLRWSVVNTAADWLPKAFVDASFDFYGKTLSGQPEIEPRWKRCVEATENALGEVVGKVYVEREFAGDSKKVALAMIHDIEDAFAANLPNLAWMDDSTRARAIAKKDALGNKIGYPDQWRDYTSLMVVKDSYFANQLASAAFEFRRQANKIGKPVDRTEWGMTPQTVNAYYNPLNNEIAFPAGILQPPFFHKDFPAAMNYGAVGTVMGHELTHGFDDSGRKFSPSGKLEEWWEPAVSARFDERAACVVKQYDAYEAEPGLHVIGKLTLGENIADIGGLRQSYDAYKVWEKRNGKPGPSLGKLSPEQLFFVAHGQVWCQLTTPEQLRLRVTTDSHSPGRFRVIGPISNHPAFAEAFQCKPGMPMTPAEKCEVW